jgi:hypothetical protein
MAGRLRYGGMPSAPRRWVSSPADRLLDESTMGSNETFPSKERRRDSEAWINLWGDISDVDSNERVVGEEGYGGDNGAMGFSGMGYI